MGRGHSFKIVKTPHHKRNITLEARADADACKRGGFIKPAMGDKVDSLKPLEIEWDPSCLPDAKSLDLFLYAPAYSTTPLQTYIDISNARAKFTAKIEPRWWEATPSVQLQLRLVPAGTETFMSQLAGAPIFEATYTAPADGSVPDVANTDKAILTETIVGDSRDQGMTGGQKAAAVLVPLIVIGLGVLAWFKWKRTRGMEKRKKWTEAVDKRMSTISTDWKSVTGAGAQAAIRNSMAANRASTFSFGAGARPSSTFEREYDEKDMAQRRPGVGLRNPSGLSNGAERVSRVSFANDPRPSAESRRTKAFRDSYVPPVPSLPSVTAKDDDNSSSEGSGAMSPTQTEGALTLTPEAIRARIAAGRARSASKSGAEKDVTEGGMEGYEEVMPALALMRTGHANTNSTDDLLFQPPAAPPAAYPKAVNSSPLAHTTTSSLSNNGTVSSPVMSSIPMPAMQAMPASVMSPDDMLRAYAERKKTMSMTVAIPAPSASATPYNGVMSPVSPTMTSGISYPSAVATAGSATPGRTLFSGVVSPQGTGDKAGGKAERPPSLGFAPGEYDPNFRFSTSSTVMGDPYGGMDDDVPTAAGAGMAGRGAYRG